ncbi:MAG: metallophosphoesterase [SAR324 cluster bacterium]|nr:metallophosphoesterase [SAR324 cluster bacterium]MCH8888009.1 metallophosphoesterase [SAR324 cluster bacterium]
MKVLLTSDTHLGLTKEPELRRMFKRMATLEADLLIHAGDYSGGFTGHKLVALTCAMLRDAMPAVPVLTVIGNHDYWSGMGPPRGRGRRGVAYAKPSRQQFDDNLAGLRKAFKEHRFWFLDQDGVYRDERFPGLVIAGHSGWYGHRIDTNDWEYLPRDFDGMDPQSHMAAQAHAGLMRNLGQLTDADTNRIFLSHFPVVEPEDYGASPNLFPQLEANHGMKRFIQGHFHRRHEGPQLWEAGSDYGKPRYVEITL